MKKKDPNYKIFRLGPKNKNSYGPSKIIMHKFYAKDDNAAYAEFKKYVKLANKEHKYYYDVYSPKIVTFPNGKCVDAEVDIEYFRLKEQAKIAKLPIGKKVLYYIKDKFDDIVIAFERWIIDPIHDVRYWFRDMAYFAKHKQYYRASWNLDYYILETLLHNVPILLKSKHGISFPFLDQARIELHKNDKHFNLEKYNNANCNYTDEEEKLAQELEKKAFEDLILAIKLYRYYTDGIVHYYPEWSTKEEIEFDRKWHHTLPIKPGTYDRLDYDKLNKLAIENWNKVWNWMKMYGQSLWD